MESKKIVWFATHPIYYQVPILREAQKKFGEKFRVVFFTDYSTRTHVDTQLNIELLWKFDYFTGYEYKILRSWPASIQGVTFFIPYVKGLFSELLKCKNSYVVAQGWNHYGMILIYIMKWFIGYTVIQRCEATDHVRSSSGIIGLVRKAIVNLTLKSSSYFGSIGSKNYDFYLKRGIEKNKIFRMPYCVDNSLYNLDRGECKREICAKYGIPDDGYIFLYVGKFIERKNPDLILEAFKDLASCEENVYLLMVGSGVMLNKSKTLNDSNRVVFCGFINQDFLPTIYAASNVFVIASKDENWGLVVNEALAAGCAVISSKDVGAAYDLIESENGILLNEITKEELLISMKIALEKFKNNKSVNFSRELIQNWSPQKNIEGLEDVIKKNV